MLNFSAVAIAVVCGLTTTQAVKLNASEKWSLASDASAEWLNDKCSRCMCMTFNLLVEQLETELTSKCVKQDDGDRTLIEDVVCAINDTLPDFVRGNLAAGNAVTAATTYCLGRRECDAHDLEQFTDKPARLLTVCELPEENREELRDFDSLALHFPTKKDDCFNCIVDVGRHDLYRIRSALEDQCSSVPPTLTVCNNDVFQNYPAYVTGYVFGSTHRWIASKAYCEGVGACSRALDLGSF